MVLLNLLWAEQMLGRIGQGRRPGRGGLGCDRLAYMPAVLHPQGESEAALAQVPGQQAAGAGAVAWHQDRPLLGGGGEQLGHDDLDSSIGSAVALPGALPT
jgi:hypothetical protein